MIKMINQYSEPTTSKLKIKTEFTGPRPMPARSALKHIKDSAKKGTKSSATIAAIAIRLKKLPLKKADVIPARLTRI